MTTLPFDLSLFQALIMAGILYGAAYVRGYCGFGFPALVVAGSGLVTDPFHFVPVVIIADLLLTAGQLRSIWPQIEWKRVRHLFIGALIGAPIGVMTLPALGEDTARAAISVYVLVMCGLLIIGWQMPKPAGRAAHIGTGIASGIANGAAVGGLPVAVFFAAQPIAAAAFRATIIAYFALLDLWTTPLMAAAGLISKETFIATAMAMPLLILGVMAGSGKFRRSDPANFRIFAIVLLATLALLGLGKALF